MDFEVAKTCETLPHGMHVWRSLLIYFLYTAWGLIRYLWQLGIYEFLTIYVSSNNIKVLLLLTIYVLVLLDLFLIFCFFIHIDRINWTLWILSMYKTNSKIVFLLGLFSYLSLWGSSYWLWSNWNELEFVLLPFLGQIKIFLAYPFLGELRSNFDEYLGHIFFFWNRKWKVYN